MPLDTTTQTDPRWIELAAAGLAFCDSALPVPSIYDHATQTSQPDPWWVSHRATTGNIAHVIAMLIAADEAA